MMNWNVLKLSLVMFCMTVLAFTASAQASGLNRSEENSAKKRAKELVKSGWESLSTQTIKEQLEGIKIEVKNNPSLIEFTSETAAQETSTASLYLMNYVAVHYATISLSAVEGEIERLVGKNTEEYNKMTVTFQQYVNKRILPLLKPKMSIMKYLPDGKVLVRATYLVDDSMAQDIRLQSLKSALKEVNRENLYPDLEVFVKATVRP